VLADSVLPPWLATVGGGGQGVDAHSGRPAADRDGRGHRVVVALISVTVLPLGLVA